MKYLFNNLFLMVSLLFSCSDEQNPAPACSLQPVYLEESSIIISDPFQIVSAKIIEECLEIEISSGGCDGARWEGQLFIFPEVAESYPPQMWSQFSLSNKEECDAIVRRSFTFDLTGLHLISDRVILHLDSWEEELLYADFDTEKHLGRWNLVNEKEDR